MSRASELRDELAALLAAAMTDPVIPVDTVVMPINDKEFYVDSPRLAVSFAERQIESMQGPDVRRIVINVAVVGALQPAAGYSLEYPDVLARERDLVDGYDGIVETVADLFSPQGTLTAARVCDHRFHTITQPSVIDSQQYRDGGLFVAILALTYNDQRDE